MNWKQTQVLVTGGATFIGSAFVDALIHKNREDVAAILEEMLTERTSKYGPTPKEVVITAD